MDAQSRFLTRMAGKYIWWQTPDYSLRTPDRILAQVMDLGDFEDTVTLRRLYTSQRLEAVLAHALPGWFRPKSWAFWHCILGKETPPLPRRRIPDEPIRPAP